MTLTDTDEVTEIVEGARSEGIFCADVESTGTNPHTDRLTGIAFKVGRKYYWVPLAGDDALPYRQTLDALQPLFDDPDVSWVNHNLSFDVQMLWGNGLSVSNKLIDTMLAVYLLEENRYHYRLKGLVKEKLGHEMTEFNELGGLFSESLGDYAIDDVRWTWKLWKHCEGRLRSEGVMNLFHKIECPFAYVVAEMEYSGCYIDVEYLEQYRKEIQRKQNECEDAAYDAAQCRFKITSPKEVSAVVFGKLGAPTDGLQRTKPGYWPTNDDVLSKFKDEYPVCKYILEFRRHRKFINTYLNQLIRKAQKSHDGRFRARFRQVGTVIGRLASRGKPQLQNIPRPTTEIIDGEEVFDPGIRKAFIAEDGNDLVVADFSQMELRMVAGLSKDPAMLKIYTGPGTCDCETYKKTLEEKGEGKCRHMDIHTATAEACKCPRNPYAKNINFGAIYRASARRLAQYSEDYTREEMQTRLNRWFQNYRNVRQFHIAVEGMLKNRTNWVATNIFGRKRRLAESREKNEYRAVTQGIQFLVSGACADVVKLSMIKFYEERNKRAKEDHRWDQARMLMQVHDEFMVECPDSISDEVAALQQECMEYLNPKLPCPMKADPGIGPNWIDAK